MAEYQEVAKMYDRLCGSYDECYKCPMFMNRKSDKNDPIGCRYWALIVDPELAEEVILRWAKEHPPVSNLDKFKEVFGFDPLTDKHLMCGTPIIGWFGKEYKEPIKEEQNG